MKKLLCAIAAMFMLSAPAFAGTEQIQVHVEESAIEQGVRISTPGYYRVVKTKNGLEAMEFVTGKPRWFERHPRIACFIKISLTLAQDAYVLFVRRRA